MPTLDANTGQYVDNTVALSSDNATITIETVGNAASWVAQITGTFSGTLTFYGSVDRGATYNAIANSAGATSTTTTGVHRGDGAGYTHIQVKMHPFVSGSATVQLTSTTAQLAKNLVVNVKDYGAIGNGSVDDTAAIQTTIAAASVSGGIVFFPPGTYKITSGLTITTSGVSLVGAGAGASIIQTPSGKEGVAMLIIGDGVNTCADVRISDLQFLGVTQKTANAAIKLQKCFRTHLERLRMQNQYRGIHVYNSTGTWISSTDLRDSSENGIVYESTLGNGFDCYLTNVLADNPVVSNNGSGILWLGGENFVIHNCDFEHYVTGFNAAPPTGQQCRFGFFSAAEFDTCSDNGIKITNQSGGDVVGLTFTTCWSGTATNYGVLVDGGGSGVLQGVRFVGHKSLHNGLAGFRLAAGLDIVLSNCDIVGNSQTSANSRSGIEIASGMTSGSFSIIGCRSSNGWQQGNTQSNGINFDSGTYTSGQIVDCDLRNNTNNALALNGATGTLHIANNQGHNPVGHITSPSMPSSTVAYTNTTGYDCMVTITGGTVTVIAVGGTATGLTSGTFRVPANQSITLTYSSTPTWTWFAD